MKRAMSDRGCENPWPVTMHEALGAFPTRAKKLACASGVSSASVAAAAARISVPSRMVMADDGRGW